MNVDRVPSLETMRSRIYDPALYPSQANLLGDLRADAIRLLDLLEDARAALALCAADTTAADLAQDVEFLKAEKADLEDSRDTWKAKAIAIAIAAERRG